MNTLEREQREELRGAIIQTTKNTMTVRSHIFDDLYEFYEYQGMRHDEIVSKINKMFQEASYGTKITSPTFTVKFKNTNGRILDKMEVK